LNEILSLFTDVKDDRDPIEIPMILNRWQEWKLDPMEEGKNWSSFFDGRCMSFCFFSFVVATAFLHDVRPWCEGMEVEMTWGVRGSDTQALGREHCRVRLHTLEACPFSRNEMVGVSLFRSLCHLWSSYQGWWKGEPADVGDIIDFRSRVGHDVRETEDKRVEVTVRENIRTHLYQRVIFTTEWLFDRWSNRHPQVNVHLW
jgi:hypothetical protein